MATPCRKRCFPVTLIAVLIIGYFLCYPQDGAVMARGVEEILRWTNVISPWLYGLVAVALVCMTALRISTTKKNL